MIRLIKTNAVPPVVLVGDNVDTYCDANNIPTVPHPISGILVGYPSKKQVSTLNIPYATPQEVSDLEAIYSGG